MRRGLITAFILGYFTTGAAGELPDCETRDCLMAHMRQNPSRQLEFWESNLARPLFERTGRMPDALLDLIRLDNRLQGYPENVAVFDQPAALRTLERSLMDLPRGVHDLIRDKLAGIYLVSNLGSTGYTNIIIDASGDTVAGVVVLDASLFERNGNAWASWRDSTAFEPDPRFRVRNRIADPSRDSNYNAVQFLLVHELGHVVSIGRKLHPRWDEDLDGIDLDDYPFASLSWVISEGQYRSRFDLQFVLREQLVYYRTPLLSARRLLEVFAQIEDTNFVSLYAATRPEEDFAESFAVYVHHELMGKPFSIEAVVDGRVVDRLGSCFHSRCRGKYELLGNLFTP